MNQVDILCFFDAHANRPLFWVLSALHKQGVPMRTIRSAYKIWLEEPYL